MFTRYTGVVRECTEQICRSQIARLSSLHLHVEHFTLGGIERDRPVIDLDDVLAGGSAA